MESSIYMIASLTPPAGLRQVQTSRNERAVSPLTWVIILLFSSANLFPAYRDVQAVEKGNAAIEMRALDVGGNSLGDRVPFFFVVSPGLRSGRAIVPWIRSHNGAQGIKFDIKESPEGTPVIGAYVPVGYAASYQYYVGKDAGPKCAMSVEKGPREWRAYDAAMRDSKASRPLQVGRELPTLQPGACLIVVWKVEEIKGYNGNIGGLFEHPNVAENGIDHLPATHVIEGAGTGVGAGSIELSVAANFGAIAKTLRIRAGNSAYLSILHNLGAPTDDGLIWGIAMKGATGLYGVSDKPIALGTSQFVGHAKGTTPFGSVMWGMTMPVVQIGSTLRPASKCKEASCFVPMFSDWTSANEPETEDGTMPFMLPRGVHPWDGQVNQISISRLAQTGTGSAVARLTYSFNYKPHSDFAAKSMRTGLWLNLALTDFSARDKPIPIGVYLVHSDGATTALDARYIASAGLAGSDTAWDQFCTRDDEPGKQCKPNPRKKNDLTCRCSFKSGEVKRIVYHYLDRGVALSLERDSGAFNPLIVGTTFRRNIRGRPFLLTAAHGRYIENRSFKRSEPAVTDTYLLNVSTLENLTAAGVGLGKQTGKQ